MSKIILEGLAHMKKVLIIQSVLPEYRVPIFNLLNKQYDVTVMVPKSPKLTTKPEFAILVAPERHIPHLGRFFVGYKNIIRQFDVCISMLAANYPQVVFSLLGKKKTKMILWGIGVSAGYGIPYDSQPKYRKVLRSLIHRANAALFYSDYPLSVYQSLGISKEKLFVANNTVAVEPKEKKNSDYLLFVGSLYPAKGVDVLLKQYNEAYQINHEIEDLLIVGDGSEREKCEKLCKDSGLGRKVTFLGSIFEEERLSELFSGAIACISPNQAGLSVLKSMGYGVPFVTSATSITGGERFNIQDKINGVIYENEEDLKMIILDIHHDRNKYIEMGKKAKAYYEKCRKPEVMVKGFVDAIEYVLRT